MQIFSTPEPLASFISEQRNQGKSIGLVPTMGALHQGHEELVRHSLKSNHLTVCSIYVNPVQFNDRQDLINYPRNLDQDLEILEKLQCNAVFCPTDQVMYPSKPQISIDFGDLEHIMEGQHRPGHFKGVALVVSKLFNMVQPTRAYFGEKDWQQLVIIKRLVNELSFPLEVIGVPVVREEDGLALSSRNQRLHPEFRSVAKELFQAMQLVKSSLEKRQPLHSARDAGISHLEQFKQIRLEYLEVVRSQGLDKPVSPLGSEPLRICLAAFLGEVRLIDNLEVF